MSRARSRSSASALTPHMRQFLDQLPRVIATKADPKRQRDDPRQQQIIARALEATLHLRQATITYHSQSSDRTKTYLRPPVPPRLRARRRSICSPTCRSTARCGRSPSSAFRISSLLDERFTPIEELPDAAFPHSLGVHSGPPERVEIEFQPAVAEYVRAREWHPSQQHRRRRRRRHHRSRSTSASIGRSRAGS